MSNLSDFIASGGKPKRVTRYTSGTGTFTPLNDNALCLVRIQGGGGAGGANGNFRGGGGAGAMVEFLIRVPIAGMAYSVGAGGVSTIGVTNGGDGSPTRFGNVTAEGGKGGGYTNPSVWPLSQGGMTSQQAGNVTASSTSVIGGSITGIAGGAGGSHGQNGSAPGFPVSQDNNGTNAIYQRANGQATGSAGNTTGGGGDSFFGIGGNAATTASMNGSNGTGYGSGGGAASATTTYKGGSGAGGLIEIIEYMGT